MIGKLTENRTVNQHISKMVPLYACNEFQSGMPWKISFEIMDSMNAYSSRFKTKKCASHFVFLCRHCVTTLKNYAQAVYQLCIQNMNSLFNRPTFYIIFIYFNYQNVWKVFITSLKIILVETFLIQTYIHSILCLSIKIVLLSCER